MFCHRTFAVLQQGTDIAVSQEDVYTWQLLPVPQILSVGGWVSRRHGATGRSPGLTTADVAVLPEQVQAGFLSAVVYWLRVGFI